MKIEEFIVQGFFIDYYQRNCWDDHTGPEPAAFCHTEWQARDRVLQLMLGVLRHDLTFAFHFATEYSHDMTRK